MSFKNWWSDVTTLFNVHFVFNPHVFDIGVGVTLLDCSVKFFTKPLFWTDYHRQLVTGTICGVDVDLSIDSTKLFELIITQWKEDGFHAKLSLFALSLEVSCTY
jgi:hypothetical protein